MKNSQTSKSWKHARSRASSGFTIIEAVVATSVFAFAAVSIVGVYLAVQRLNQASATLQALQQNGRFVTEDITKIVRNGQIDYASYPGSLVSEPSTGDLYLIDRDGVHLHIFQSGTVLVIGKTGFGSSNLTGAEVKVLNFKAFVWPSTDPFAGGSVLQQPTVTVYLQLQGNVYPRDQTLFSIQTTAVTRQYPK